MALKIADKEFTSRLFTGTGKFASNQLMEDAILASESQLVTVALKRVNMDGKDDDILAHLKAPHITLFRRENSQRGRVRRATGERGSRHELAETGNTSRSQIPVARPY